VRQPSVWRQRKPSCAASAITVCDRRWLPYLAACVRTFATAAGNASNWTRCVHVCMRACVHVRMCECVHACMCACVHVCSHVFEQAELALSEVPLRPLVPPPPPSPTPVARVCCPRSHGQPTTVPCSWTCARALVSVQECHWLECGFGERMDSLHVQHLRLAVRTLGRSIRVLSTHHHLGTWMCPIEATAKGLTPEMGSVATLSLPCVHPQDIRGSCTCGAFHGGGASLQWLEDHWASTPEEDRGEILVAAALTAATLASRLSRHRLDLLGVFGDGDTLWEPRNAPLRDWSLADIVTKALARLIARLRCNSFSVKQIQAGSVDASSTKGGVRARCPSLPIYCSFLTPHMHATTLTAVRLPRAHIPHSHPNKIAQSIPRMSGLLR